MRYTSLDENLENPAIGPVYDGLRVYTGAGMLYSPVKVLLSTEVATNGGRSGARGRRIPEMCIKVRIHPQSPQTILRGDMGPGALTSLESLNMRVRMWRGGAGGCRKCSRANARPNGMSIMGKKGNSELCG